MKRIIFLFTATVLLYGCTDQGEETSRIVFTMFNETDVEVRIQAFDTRDEMSGTVYEQPIAAEEIRIEPNSEYTIVRYSTLEEALLTAFYSIEGVDYIRITFNNERFREYNLDDAAGTPDYNIFIGNDSCQHFISPQDYETANICNGVCD